MRTKLLFLISGGLFLVACGKSGGGIDAPLEIPGHTPGMPGLGVHAMSFYHLASNDASSISTAPMITQPGSTIVVSVGRGDITAFALPMDNKGGTAQQLGDVHAYTHYNTSGTALYTFPSAAGGSDYTIRTTTKQGDEITLAAVEVIEGSKIQDFVWNEVVQPATPIPVTSKSVTTTGPATLIAFWWGDGFPGTPQSATADNDFIVVDTNAQERDSFVQCAVAVKNVTAPGTYDVTWTSTPVQGAQLWLVAVQ